MKTFEVIAREGVTFHSGILLLTPEQAKARPRVLIPLGDDLYEIKQPTQFKLGEVLGYDGDVSKDMLKFIKSVQVTIPHKLTKPLFTWADGNVNEALAQCFKVEIPLAAKNKKAGK